jgi:hypothetical protein
MKLLGPPALWRGESRNQYDAILLGMAISVGARDIIDWVSVNDLTYHVWDGRRLQTIKAALILAKQIEVIEGLLKSTYYLAGPERDANYYISGVKNDARRWAADSEFGSEIDDRLAARGHDSASILGRPILCVRPNCRPWTRPSPTESSVEWPACAKSIVATSSCRADWSRHHKRSLTGNSARPRRRGRWHLKSKYLLTGRTRSKAAAHAAPVGRRVPAETRPDTVLLPISGTRRRLSGQSNSSRNYFVLMVTPNKMRGWRR